jgi:hypothetical protein
VGGFPGKQMVGDFELWHILAARYPIVLMPDGIVWYREHGEQEMNDCRHNPLLLLSYQLIASEQLARPECPLSQEEKILALRRLRRRKVRLVLRTMASRKPRLAFEMFRQSGLTPSGFLAGFFGELRAILKEGLQTLGDAGHRTLPPASNARASFPRESQKALGIHTDMGTWFSEKDCLVKAACSPSASKRR